MHVRTTPLLRVALAPCERRAAPSLRGALRGWVCQVAGFVVGFLVVALVMLLTGGPGMAAGGVVVGRESDAPDADHRPDRVARLVVRHHCWRSSAPEQAGIPGHAVVARSGRRARLVPAEVGFGIWLDDRPGTLYAFCP